MKSHFFWVFCFAAVAVSPVTAQTVGEVRDNFFDTVANDVIQSLQLRPMFGFSSNVASADYTGENFVGQEADIVLFKLSTEFTGPQVTDSLSLFWRPILSRTTYESSVDTTDTNFTFNGDPIFLAEETEADAAILNFGVEYNLSALNNDETADIGIYARPVLSVGVVDSTTNLGAEGDLATFFRDNGVSGSEELGFLNLITGGGLEFGGSAPTEAKLKDLEYRRITGGFSPIMDFNIAFHYIFSETLESDDGVDRSAEFSMLPLSLSFGVIALDVFDGVDAELSGVWRSTGTLNPDQEFGENEAPDTADELGGRFRIVDRFPENCAWRMCFKGVEAEYFQTVNFFGNSSSLEGASFGASALISF